MMTRLSMLTALALLPGISAAQDPFTNTYSSAGRHYYLVPAGVSAVTLKAWGAGGGGGRNDGVVSKPGGGGGFVQGTFVVSDGDQLFITAGAGGGGGLTAKSAGGGGGWTGVSNGTISVVLLVAGAGGGGGGGDNHTHAAGAGGAGGGTNGVAGEDSVYLAGGAPTPSRGGGGGTQTTGGAGGESDGNEVNGTDGGALTGGTGGRGPGGGAGGDPGGGDGGLGAGNDSAGGGGGSGWYGGGGGGGGASSHDGGGAGGGGGASYVHPAATATSNTTGSGTAPANAADPDYAGSAGLGGANGVPGVAGSPGRVVLRYDATAVTIVFTFPEPATSTITTDSATAHATVGPNDTTQTALVWEQAATAPSPFPGQLSDWDHSRVLGPSTAGAISGTLTNLLADTDYIWRFHGTNSSDGVKGWSEPVAFYTHLSDAQAPAFTSATVVTAARIRLGWATNALHATHYVLRRSTNGVDYATVTNLPVPVTSYLDTPLNPDTAYYYELAATNANDGSGTTFSLARTNATTYPLVERFVATTGSDIGNDGLSWANPHATIARALERGDAHLVTVGAGTYTTTAETQVDDPGFPVTIRSHVNGRNGGPANAPLTVIDRGGSGSRVFTINHPDAVLDGFTITGGSGTGGGGIHLAAGRVRHCIIEGNRVSGGGGGGIHLPAGGSGIVSNCIIRANTNALINNEQSGGGVYAYSGTITHCQILDNVSARYGGGIACGRSGTIIRNCLIARNRGVGGGWGGGGGVYVWTGGPLIESCTIVSNRVTTANKGGGISHRTGSAQVRNCIVYFNTAGGVADDYALATSYATHTCSPDATSGTGNLTADPLLEALAAGDYRLTPASPCKDAGNTAVATWLTDLAGKPRLTGSAVDMGAYEYAPPGGAIVIIR